MADIPTHAPEHMLATLLSASRASESTAPRSTCVGWRGERGRGMRKEGGKGRASNMAPIAVRSLGSGVWGLALGFLVQASEFGVQGWFRL